MQALIFILCCLACTAILVSLVLLYIKRHVQIIGIDADEANNIAMNDLDNTWRK